MYSFWDSERDKKEEEKLRKKNLRLIGTNVDSFFIDKMQELKLEERSGQWEMALEIVQGMIDDQHVLVEAGVGIGKTYAYVVPLLYYHKKYGKPIIIATSTIALQEQLENDIKTIEKILDYYPSVFIAKGQSHFLCINRLEQYFVGKEDTEEYIYYEEICRGGYERSNWNMDIPDQIWNRINVLTFNPVTCRQTCPHKDRCFYYQLRIKLKDTNGFILCNQDLLAMNMKKRSRGNTEIFVSDYEYIVIDEVHNLESRVRNAHTIAVSYSECKKVMWDLSRDSKRMGGLLDKRIEYCLTLLDQVFSNLLLQVKKQDKNAIKEDKEIEKYYVDNNIKELCDLVKALNDTIETVSLDFGMEDTYRNRGEKIPCGKKFIQPMLYDNRGVDLGKMIDSLNKFGISKSEKRVVIYIISFTRANSVNDIMEDSTYKIREIAKASTILKILKDSSSIKRPIKVITFFNKCDLLYNSEQEFIDDIEHKKVIEKYGVDELALISQNSDYVLYGSAVMGWEMSELKNIIAHL